MASITRLLERNVRNGSGAMQLRLFSAQTSPAGTEGDVEDEG